MVFLKCKQCSYEVTYSDASLKYLVSTAKKNARYVPAGQPGFHCPSCKRYPLRVLKSKEPTVKP